MFERIKAAAKRAKHLLLIAVACALSLMSMALVPTAAENDANAMYIVAEDSYISVDHPSVEVFLTDANAELISHENGTDLLLRADLKVTINYNGDILTTISENETVRALLDRMSIYPSPLEMVALAFGENTLNIDIASEFVFYEHITSVTEHEVIYQYNKDWPEWYEEVIQPGSDGVYSEVYEIVYQDGVETGRQLIDLIDTEPVTAIIEKGTIPNFAHNDDPVSSITTNEDGTGYITLENGQVITFNQVRTMKGTAYNCNEPGLGTITASGTTVHWGVVAVDRKVIPLGTKLYIVSNDGYLVYGFAIAEDTGVRGERIDLYMESMEEMKQFGVRNCTVYILD